MGLPWFGLLSSVAAALGLYGLFWYERLSPQEKAQADRLAEEYAQKLFRKGLRELTRHQLDLVQSSVKTHFAV